MGALLKLLPAIRDWRLSLSQKLDRIFGDNEAVKCALAANLSYYHDDPATLWWMFFAMAQGSYLLSGGRFVQGGSQRLSSALARAVRVAGGDVLVRRIVSGIALDAARPRQHRHPHRQATAATRRLWKRSRIISNAAPAALAPLMPAAAAEKLTESYTRQAPSISLFALTLGLSKPPREFGISAYSTQLLPREMTRLSDYAQGAELMANEPGERMPPMSIVDYAAIDSGVPAPPYVLSICGPDALSNWDSSDMDAYREKRGRWQAAIVGYLDSHLSRSRSQHRCVVVQQRAFGAAVSQRPRRRGLRVRADPAALDLAHALPVRRARRCRAFIWRRPMQASAATPAWCNPPALART